MAGKSEIRIARVATDEGAAVRRPRPAARALGFVLAGLVALLVLVGGGAQAASRKAEAVGSTANGFARLVLTFPEEIETEVRQTNGILIIRFKQPLDIAVDHLPIAMRGYISVARRDPDGAAIRLALSRKVTIHTMAAGERLFVDLLPEGWTGLPPGLPQEVIDELARRAREAERRARQQERQRRAREALPIRVRVATLPTVTRYTFELREPVAVSTERRGEILNVVFDEPLRFDLADAKAALPPTVAAIDAETDEDSATVRFVFVGKVDVRSFRDEEGFVVDVSAAGAREGAAQAPDLAAPEDLGALVMPAVAKRLAPGADYAPRPRANPKPAEVRPSDPPPAAPPRQKAEAPQPEPASPEPAPAPPQPSAAAPASPPGDAAPAPPPPPAPARAPAP
ncbi:MAG: tetratricopeptide repeat protein, partial [Variibacter sp.]|nr:tetratricopeptide repeat protein [Variibacter sp.]